MPVCAWPFAAVEDDADIIGHIIMRVIFSPVIECIDWHICIMLRSSGNYFQSSELLGRQLRFHLLLRCRGNRLQLLDLVIGQFQLIPEGEDRRGGHRFSRLRREPRSFRIGRSVILARLAQEPISPPLRLQAPRSPSQSDKVASIGRSALRAFSCYSASGCTSRSDTNTNTSMSRWNTNISTTTTSTTSTSTLHAILKPNLMPIGTDTRG